MHKYVWDRRAMFFEENYALKYFIPHLVSYIKIINFDFSVAKCIAFFHHSHHSKVAQKL